MCILVIDYIFVWSVFPIYVFHLILSALYFSDALNIFLTFVFNVLNINPNKLLMFDRKHLVKICT